jgi:hypothetical protein
MIVAHHHHHIGSAYRYGVVDKILPEHCQSLFVAESEGGFAHVVMRKLTLLGSGGEVVET